MQLSRMRLCSVCDIPGAKNAKLKMNEAYHNCSSFGRGKIIAARKCENKTKTETKDKTVQNVNASDDAQTQTEYLYCSKVYRQKHETMTRVKYRSSVCRPIEKVMKEGKIMKKIWAVWKRRGDGGSRGGDSSALTSVQADSVAAQRVPGSTTSGWLVRTRNQIW